MAISLTSARRCAPIRLPPLRYGPSGVCSRCNHDSDETLVEVVTACSERTKNHVQLRAACAIAVWDPLAGRRASSSSPSLSSSPENTTSEALQPSYRALQLDLDRQARSV